MIVSSHIMAGDCRLSNIVIIYIREALRESFFSRYFLNLDEIFYN
nr:MAG TPA: hypothetical protein [Caudoviricetes sp.]